MGDHLVRPPRRRGPAAAVLLAAALCGCTANRVVASRPALPGAQRLELAEARLVVNSFRTNAATPEERYAEQVLKSGFLEMLRLRTHFSQVVDGTTRPVAEDASTLRLDVLVFAEHTRNRTIVLDIPFFYPFLGYWPVSPLWGTATVTLTATFAGRSGEPVQFTTTGQSSYGMLFYSWYRTEPIESAYAEAYGRAFEALAVELARQQPAMRAALGPARPAVPLVAEVPLGAAPPGPALLLQQPPASGASRRIAVLEFRGEASPNVLALVADEARAGALAATRGQPFVVMTRESMAVLLKDMGQGGECKEGECEVETARNIGADFVVTGELQTIEELLFLSLKLHQVQSGALLNTARVSGKSTVEVLEKVREAAASLFR